MVNLRRLLIFGYLDLFTSVFQVFLTLFSTILFLYFYFENQKPDKIDPNLYSLPTFCLLVAALVIFASNGQIFVAQKLIEAGITNASAEDIKVVKIKWVYWNVSTCFVPLIWYPLAITMFLEYDFDLLPFGICFVVYGGTRTMLLCGINKAVEEEVAIDQVPPLPDVVLGPAIIMGEIPHQRWMN